MSQSKARIYYVTESFRCKKRVTSKVVGFVSVFGWESAEDKAARKYPHNQNISLHEKPRRVK